MPSPFPGMDPYLEQPAYWPDFHGRFINYWCEALADVLPEPYEAAINERVSLVELAPDRAVRIVGPDVALLRGQPSEPASPSSHDEGGVATLTPVLMELHLEEEEVVERYIELRLRPERTLVAVLELLSPDNKQRSGYGKYLTKRKMLLDQDVHLVELDLLLGGERVPARGSLPSGDYYYVVARGDRRPQIEVFAWNLAQPMPKLPVPLRAPDPDVLVDLAAVLHTVYDRGRFGKRIDYSAALRIAEPTRGWAAAVAARQSRP